MRILERYIGVSVAASTGVVMIVMLALFMFTLLVGELDDVGKGTYSLWKAGVFVLASLPRVAYQLFPSVALLGSIVGLGLLARHNELLVMRAAGVSMGQITTAVMKTGLILMIVSAVIGEGGAPPAERYAQNMRAAALADRIMLKAGNGFWARDGRQFIHIRDLFPDGSLGEISIYEFDDSRRLADVTRAARAYYQGDAWVLEGIVRTSLEGAEIRSETLANTRWDSLLNPQLVSIVSVQPEFLSARGLYSYIDYLRQNGLSAKRYELALWRKIFSPLSTGVMVFLAIPFVFGPLRSVSIGQRVLVGALVGIAFYVSNQLISYAGLIYELPPLLAVVAPPALFLGFGVWLARRVR